MSNSPPQKKKLKFKDEKSYHLLHSKLPNRMGEKCHFKGGFRKKAVEQKYLLHKFKFKVI